MKRTFLKGVASNHVEWNPMMVVSNGLLAAVGAHHAMVLRGQR